MNKNIFVISSTAVAAVVVTWALISMTTQTTIVNTSLAQNKPSSVDNTKENQFVSPVEKTTIVYLQNNVKSEQNNISVESAVAIKKDSTDKVNDISVAIPSLPDTVTVQDYPYGLKQDAVVISLQEKFYTEPYDEVWAAKTEQQLMDLFVKSNSVGNQLEEATCRTTFCRIDVSHADIKAEQNFIATFATSGQFIDDGEQGFYHREADDNGFIRTVFYYARKGHQLPINTKKNEAVN